MRFFAIFAFMAMLSLSAAARGEQCDSECSDCAWSKEADCCVACSAKDKIEHLLAAADHLAAAGMAEEAEHAREQVNRLRDELLEQKVAELARLEAEVDRLRRAVGQARQVLVHVQVVEVSLTNMRKLGIGLKTTDESCPCAGVASSLPADCDHDRCEESITFQVCESESIAKLVETMRAKDFLKVLAEPILVTLDGHPASFACGTVGTQAACPLEVGEGALCGKSGTQVDFTPTLLGSRKVRMKIRPMVRVVDSSNTAKLPRDTVPGFHVVEMDVNTEMNLGQTLVLGGPVQQRHVAKASGKEPAALNEVQTLFLLTPELWNGAPPAPNVGTARAPQATQPR